MEHICQQCGTTVEDGRPFCPQCRAPQIHVQVAIPDAEIDAGLKPALDELSQEIPQAGYNDCRSVIGGRAAAGTEAGSRMERGVAVRAALKAGVLGVFIGIIPVLGIVLTGALGVYFYRRESGLAPPAAVGARVGGAAGVVAFVINAVMIAIRIFVFHARQEYADAILKFAQRFGTNVADPDVQASVRNLFTASGLALTFFIGMMIAVALASAGGALASLWVRPRNTRV